jgi:hypothetical protein
MDSCDTPRCVNLALVADDLLAEQARTTRRARISVNLGTKTRADSSLPTRCGMQRAGVISSRTDGDYLRKSSPSLRLAFGREASDEATWSGANGTGTGTDGGSSRRHGD